jgi:hypothetical protein
MNDGVGDGVVHLLETLDIIVLGPPKMQEGQ